MCWMRLHSKLIHSALHFNDHAFFMKTFHPHKTLLILDLLCRSLCVLRESVCVYVYVSINVCNMYVAYVHALSMAKLPYKQKANLFLLSNSSVAVLFTRKSFWLLNETLKARHFFFELWFCIFSLFCREAVFLV